MGLKDLIKKALSRKFRVVNNGATRRNLSAKYPDQKRLRRLFGHQWKPILK